ncbi:MAG: hypothetical protein QOI38_128 [Sphingomonadales bacterium]|jgi:hypothetical protein|nr:hypothetical protein [Sphingomonadales bacterium]
MPSRVPATIRDRLTFYHSMPGGDNPLLLTDVKVTSNTQNERDRTATGLHVIVDDRDDEQILYGVTALPAETKRSNATGLLPVQKVTKLTIICDTLTVRCRWWMPECDVIVFARQILFEGEGCIDTSPAPWELARARDAYDKTPGANGANGRSGGKVTIYARDVDAPAGSRAKRIITDGGKGQDAGRGLDGKDGRNASGALTWIGDDYTDEKSWKDSFRTTTVKVKLNDHKGKTILGIRRIWRTLEIERSNLVQGTTEPPGDGDDAIRPGDAGSGGAPGVLATNLAGLIALWQARPGKAGAQAPTAKGGAAGWPQQSVFYECEYRFKAHLWPDPYDNSDEAKVKHWDYSTRKGATLNGQPGNDADPVSIDLSETEANVWLHSALVPLVQDYVRTCYLRGDEAEAQRLVDLYAPVFLGEIPLKRGIWQQRDTPYWRGLQAEFATLQQRLANHLDYFGKPAGYSPMLSLASSFQLYRMDVDLALEVLMFTAWVAAKQNEQRELAEAARAASQLIIKESAAIAARIEAAETRAEKLRADADALEQAQNDVHAALAEQKTRLYNEASGNIARVGQIKLAVNLGAALLQVFPYGQPILGGIAGAGADAFDLLDKEPDEVLKTVKTRLTDTAKAYKESSKETEELVKKAKADAKELKTAAGKKLSVEEIKKLAKTKPTAWSTAGKGVAEAGALVGKAYKAAQVSQAEIEVQLAKLASKDEKWNALVKRIKELIEQRGAIHAALLEVNQEVGQGYADLASNYDALAALNGEEASARARTMTGDTFRIIEGIRNRARLSLTQSLYNVVRAFESALFKPVNINWSLDVLAEKINTLISGKPMHSWTDTELKDRVGTLRTAFMDNLSVIRQALIGDLSAIDMKDRHVDFDIKAGPVLDALNQGLSVEIDSAQLGVIEPDWQHQMLADLKIRAIEFEAGAEIPEEGDAEIIVEISELGVVRDGGRLFGLRLAAPVVETFRYHFESETLDQAEQSEYWKDLMDLILGKEGASIRQKLAMPSAWSSLTLRANFSRIGAVSAPRIRRIAFSMTVSSLVAPRQQIVLEARASDGSSPIVMDGNPYVEIYRVSDRPGATVELSVDPAAANGAKFRQWAIRQGGQPRTVKEPKLKIELKTHARVEAQFERV